jgi:hypothetical protein
MSNLLTLYAVRNRDGKFFRAKGFGGSGDTWVDEIGKAKIYPRIGQARSRVTYFANNYPQFGIPELVELHVTEIVAVQETNRVQKAQDRKIKKEAESKKRHAEWQRQEAERQIADAQRTLARLGSHA